VQVINLPASIGGGGVCALFSSRVKKTPRHRGGIALDLNNERPDMTALLRLVQGKAG